MDDQSGELDDEVGGEFGVGGLEFAGTSELVVSFESVGIVDIVGFVDGFVDGFGIDDFVGTVGSVDIVGIVVVGNCFEKLELELGLEQVQVLQPELELVLERKQDLIHYRENQSLVLVVAEPENSLSDNALYCHVSAVAFRVQIATKHSKEKIRINQLKLHIFYALLF